MDDTARAGDDGTGPWAAYIRHAIARAGSVAALARRSGLHRSTIFEWRGGAGADSLRVSSIHAIADAIGDDRRNALRAAGGTPADETPPPPSDPPVNLPPLHELLKDIYESGASPEDQLVSARLTIANYRLMQQQAHAAHRHRSA